MAGSSTRWRRSRVGLALMALAAGLLVAAPSVAQAAACPTVDPVTFTVTPAPSAGVDWTGCSLKDAELTSATLSGANLTGVLALRVKLSGADLSGADLKYSVLPAARLDGANLANTNLTGAMLTFADITNADFTGATLTGVRSGGLQGVPQQLPADWSVVAGYLVGPGANLEKANLRGADLDGVDLTGADLYGADLDGADLGGTNLSGVRTGGIVGTPASLPADRTLFQGYLIGPGANLFQAFLKDANLPNAKLAAANLVRANLSGADLSGADLARASLGLAALANTNLSGADLTQASLGTDLLNTNLSGADLTKAYLGGSDLTGADLTNANLTGAYLREAKGCSIKGGGSVTLPPDYTLSGGCLVRVTRLTVSAHSAPVAYGESARLDGDLRLRDGLGLARRPVQILAKPYGATSWTTIGTATTVDFTAGGFQAWPRPSRNTYFMAKFAGDTTVSASSTDPVLVTVRPAVSLWLNDSTATRNQTVRFVGTISPDAPNRTVYLQRYMAGKWSIVKAARVDSNNVYRLSWKPPSNIDYSFRVYIPASPGYVAAVTPAKKLTVA